MVKFFNSVDGYGFIRRRQSDVYVHRSDIADGKLLLRGDKVCFDVSWILENEETNPAVVEMMLMLMLMMLLLLLLLLFLLLLLLLLL